MNYIYKLNYDSITFIISGSLIESEITNLIEIYANEIQIQEDFDSVITFLAEQEGINGVESINDMETIFADDIINNA